jgi:glycosyltransferase involved in cell wall biosynthesis
MKPLVSILIPVYNRENLVAQTIESALSQTYKNIEIIIVDNCSTDNTWEVLEKYSKSDQRIKIFKNLTNLGPVRNWIRCIEECSGEYSNFLYSDDIIHENFIDITLGILHKSKKIGFVRTKITDRDKNLQVEKIISNKKEEKMSGSLYIYKKITGHGSLPNSPVCCLFRTKDLRKNLIIDVPNKHNLDFNFFGAGNDLLMHLLTAVDYPYVVYTERTFAGLKGHEGSFTTTNDLAKYYFIAKQFFCKKQNFIILYFMLNVYKLIFGLPKTKNL